MRTDRPIAITVFAVILVVASAAQSQRLLYPTARKGDVVDDYFGTKIADPYRWMEDLNAPEVKQWVDAENAVTFKYLDALPVRDAFKKRITDLYNYPRVSTPYYQGRHWFYSRNTGLQRQSVIFTRENDGLPLQAGVARVEPVAALVVRRADARVVVEIGDALLERVAHRQRVEVLERDGVLGIDPLLHFGRVQILHPAVRIGDLRAEVVVHHIAFP